MKIIKYILSIILIISGIRAFVENNILAGFIFIILGILIIPQLSIVLKNRFKLWDKNAFRYTLYAILILGAGATLPKRTKAVAKQTPTKSEKIRKEVRSTHKSKTCNYGGDDLPTIPSLVAADVYLNFENKGFKIDKQIKNEYTSILCTLSERKIKYTVDIEGCSPTELIEITALVLDYSGNNLKETTAFFGYVATLQYEGAEPEKARQWVRENIDKDGAEITIGSVKFNINFKTRNSKALTLQSIK